MRSLTTRHQLFGDLNKQLNAIRARMNSEVEEKALEILQKKRGEHHEG